MVDKDNYLLKIFVIMTIIIKWKEYHCFLYIFIYFYNTCELKIKGLHRYQNYKYLILNLYFETKPKYWKRIIWRQADTNNYSFTNILSLTEFILVFVKQVKIY